MAYAHKLDEQPRPVRVLVVEDEIVVSEDIQQRLTALGFQVIGAADTGEQAFDLACTAWPDVALMDIMLHGKPDGLLAAERIRTELNIPIIYLTAHSDAATLKQARLTDPSGYIVKPFDDNQLRVAVELAPIRYGMERKARQMARWLSATLHSIGDAVITTDTDAMVVQLNPAAETLTGWSQAEAVGLPCASVLRLIDKSTGMALPDPARNALAHGVVVYIEPGTTLITRVGKERIVNDSASPITDDGGKILGAVVVVNDITDHVAAKHKINVLTGRVSAMISDKENNVVLSEELEAYATTVSRELRGPLTAISGFAYLLAKTQGEKLDASGHNFLNNMRSGVRQLESMIGNYLDFLRLNRKLTLNGGYVQMMPLIKSECEQLSGHTPTERPKFVCTDLPQVWGDEHMLRQAWANLLGLTIELSPPGQVPMVKIGAIAGEEFHTFYVFGQNAELPQQMAEQLTQPCRALYDREASTGGIKLSNTRRQIEYHGGKLWADRAVTDGLTLFCTMPSRPLAEPA